MAPAVVKSAFGSAVAVFFEYDTPRIVHIKSKKVGVINRFLQLVIIGYVIGYAIIFKKGYQDTDIIQGAITTKLKGVGYTNYTNSTIGIIPRIWDVADYVVPPQENNAFFVMTNMIITEPQHLGECAEDLDDIPGADCTNNASVCLPADQPFPTGNGYRTGNCVEAPHYPGRKACEIHAWCPTEKGFVKPPDPPALLESKDFTVFIKNNIEFPKFEVKRRNILPDVINATQLRNCRFDTHANKFCPIFVLGDVTGLTGNDYASMAPKGGVVQIIITWDCNLDYDVTECLPEYTFRRLDSKDDTLSPGYNFRYAHNFKYEENGTDYRTLFKAYGIKFIVTLQGKAGKFSIVPLVLNIGSGLALLTIATVVCDIVVLYVLKAKAVYYEKKYLTVVGDDAYKRMDEKEGD